ncbi:MAG: BMP family ABC transporter substrate-binding protein [Ruthenibacterium sp.]
MKKLLAVAMVLVLSLAVFAGCGNKKAELALITDTGAIDDKSFNQGAWEGLVKYAEEKNVSKQYYKPSKKTTDAYLAAIDLAVKGGAKIIVTPGSLFEESIFIAQDTYPDVKFILIDGNPHNADYSVFNTAANTVGITYAEEQAGFLAGYAAVKEGMTKLGFMGGMVIPSVVRFGYGFVQGAEYAAAELGMADGSVEMQYSYTGGFEATPEAQAMATAWYNSGAECIFACGGSVGSSVMAAAEVAGAKVIGVDVDQSAESVTVVTSAMKGLGSSVYDTIASVYAGEFLGGQNLVFNAANNGVSIAMDTAKFTQFTQADYDALYAKLVNDTDNTASNIINTPAENGSVAGANIPLKAVALTEVQ